MTNLDYGWLPVLLVVGLVLVGWGLCRAAAAGDRRLERARASLAEHNGNTIDFPARLRVVEDAIADAGDEVGATVFEWPHPVVAPSDGGTWGEFLPDPTRGNAA